MTEPRLPRPRCPECKGTRSIRTDTIKHEDIFYCPKCGHVWHATSRQKEQTERPSVS